MELSGAAQTGGAKPERKAPSCSKSGPQKKKGLFGMNFAVPGEMKMKKVRDVDYVLFTIHPKGNKEERLELWSGPHVGSGYPEQELRSSSEGIVERKWSCPENGGTDISGRTRDGKYWRTTTMFEGFARYEKVSEETSRKFDQIIDGMCCDAEFFRKLTGGR
ncbi:MAG TPA: hypothetical protein VF240_05265 [Pyrinomonadaceae bacterium]